MSADKRQKLEAIFKQLDSNDDGVLEYKELLPAIMTAFGLKEEDAKKICLVSFSLKSSEFVQVSFLTYASVWV